MEDLIGGFPKLGVLFLGGPHTKDLSELGSIIVGVPLFREIPII